jgi:hypothetical protein
MISLRPASSQERGVLDNLVQLYCHDWSELVPLDVGLDGRFGGLALEPYWSDDWLCRLLSSSTLGSLRISRGRDLMIGLGFARIARCSASLAPGLPQSSPPRSRGNARAPQRVQAIDGHRWPHRRSDPFARRMSVTPVDSL